MRVDGETSHETFHVSTITQPLWLPLVCSARNYNCPRYHEYRKRYPLARRRSFQRYSSKRKVGTRQSNLSDGCVLSVSLLEMACGGPYQKVLAGLPSSLWLRSSRQQRPMPRVWNGEKSCDIMDTPLASPMRLALCASLLLHHRNHHLPAVEIINRVVLCGHALYALSINTPVDQRTFDFAQPFVGDLQRGGAGATVG